MKAAVRGRFATLVEDDDSPIVLEYETEVYVPPHPSGGKDYATIAAHPRMREVDAEIQKRCPIEFSPLSGTKVIVKLGPKALVDDVHPGDDAVVKVKLGNYGTHGYCWVAMHLVRP